MTGPKWTGPKWARFAAPDRALVVRVADQVPAPADPVDAAHVAVFEALSLPDRGRPLDAYLLGLKVAEYLAAAGVTDYQLRDFAARFGVAFNKARQALADAVPVLNTSPGPDDDGDLTAVADAVGVLRAPGPFTRSVVVRLPANVRRVTS